MNSINLIIETYPLAERNYIEAEHRPSKFGQGKTKYGLNKIMAKLANTNQSWIGAIVLVLNILKLSEDIFVPFVNSVQNLLNHTRKLLNSIPKVTLKYEPIAAQLPFIRKCYGRKRQNAGNKRRGV